MNQSATFYIWTCHQASLLSGRASGAMWLLEALQRMGPSGGGVWLEQARHCDLERVSPSPAPCLLFFLIVMVRAAFPLVPLALQSCLGASRMCTQKCEPEYTSPPLNCVCRYCVPAKRR